MFPWKGSKGKKKVQEKNNKRIKQNITNISVNGGRFLFPLQTFLMCQ